MSVAENKAVIQNWMAARNANDLDLALTYWTPDNHEWLSKAFQHFSTAFPDIHVTVNEMIAEGDKVVALWTLTGTQQGGWRGIPGTSHMVEWPGTDVYTLSSGKIAELARSADHWDLLKQLGAILKWQDMVIE